MSQFPPNRRRFRRGRDVRYRVVGGQAVVIVQEAGEAIVLNEVGTRVLELIDRQLTFQEIADDLCEQFEVAGETAVLDLERYLSELLEAGVVEHIESDSSD